MTEPCPSRLTAVLSRGPGQPAGDPRCGIEIDLCLDPQGQMRSDCATNNTWPVRRFWPDRGDWHGELVKMELGWGVRSTGGDDEPVWELHTRTLRPGDYLTLVRPTDDELLFRVVNVEPLN